MEVNQLDTEINAVPCRIVMWDTSYEVFFNNALTVTVQLDHEASWQQIEGEPLPAHVVAAIGEKIEAWCG